MEDKTGALTAAQRRTLQQGLADCASCGDKAAYLRAIGVPNEELEARKDHTSNVIQTALDIDTQLKARK